MAERIWSPSLSDLQRDVIENTPQVTKRTLCFYCIEGNANFSRTKASSLLILDGLLCRLCLVHCMQWFGARCPLHWPSRIRRINDTQFAFNDTAQSVKRLLDVLRKQSEQRLLESGLRGGFARLQSVRVPKRASPARLQNKTVLTTPLKSIIDGVTTGNTSDEKTLEIEEVLLPPKKPEVTDNSRQKYQRFREKKFTCEHCGHTFTLKHNMQTHIANYHTGEGRTLRPRGKRYKCLKCGWRAAIHCFNFLFQEVFLPPKKPEVADNSRQKYQRFREKKFTCEHCGHTFTLKHNMQTHIANYHSGEGRTLRPRGKRYKCLKCGWMCRTTNEVKSHQRRLHDTPKEKRHTCVVCNKNFRSHGLMREHYSTVHLNERPYECTICMTSFGRKGGLRRHNIMKHSDFVYACPYEECTHPGFKCSKV
uniref:Zinc finger protein n=1 Tax=Ascaris lumbricoides TaxID=6252 RepID=A0A0M3I3E7_ASCLU